MKQTSQLLVEALGTHSHGTRDWDAPARHSAREQISLAVTHGCDSRDIIEARVPAIMARLEADLAENDRIIAEMVRAMRQNRQVRLYLMTSTSKSVIAMRAGSRQPTPQPGPQPQPALGLMTRSLVGGSALR